jgi:hypothetical protein
MPQPRNRNENNYETRMLQPDLYSFTQYCSCDQRRMRWAGVVARVGERELYTGFWWGHLKERDHLGDPGEGGRIILSWIFRKWDVWVWTGSGWLRIETGGGQL